MPWWGQIGKIPSWGIWWPENSKMSFALSLVSWPEAEGNEAYQYLWGTCRYLVKEQRIFISWYKLFAAVFYLSEEPIKCLFAVYNSSYFSPFWLFLLIFNIAGVHVWHQMCGDFLIQNVRHGLHNRRVSDLFYSLRKTWNMRQGMEDATQDLERNCVLQSRKLMMMDGKTTFVFAFVIFIRSDKRENEAGNVRKHLFPCSQIVSPCWSFTQFTRTCEFSLTPWNFP